MAINWVIYHRNNAMLGLSNHIDKDGDLDANYALLRNVALTGKMVNGKFITKNKKHFNWLVDCAKKGCPICNRIFVDTKNGDYNITDFYMQKVVKLESGVKTKINEPQVKTKWDKLAKKVTSAKIKSNKENEQHPLFDVIMKKFYGRIID